MNTFWSKYEGLLHTKHDISDGVIVPDKLMDEPELLKSLLSCLRTKELPLYNNKPLLIRSLKLT